MKFIRKICLFFNAIRWYIRENKMAGMVDNGFNDESYKAFCKEYKDEYECFSDKLRLNEIKEAFEFFNAGFRRNEVAAIITGINEYEKIYRHRNSVSWTSHGNVLFAPYFTSKYQTKYIPLDICLTLYFYVIASYMDVDFYPSKNSGFIDKCQFTAESMRNKPYYIKLINDKYSVTDDFKVNIE